MKRYYFDNKENLFRQEDSTAFNEAAVLFTGEISYSRELPEECFRYLDVALSESDFAFAPVSMGAGLFKDILHGRTLLFPVLDAVLLQQRLGVRLARLGQVNAFAPGGAAALADIIFLVQPVQHIKIIALPGIEVFGL